MELIYKVNVGRVMEKADGKPLVALVSTPDVDLVGDVILPMPNERGAGWDVRDFNGRGGRINWMHDSYTRPNLAKATARASDEGLVLEVAFDMKDSFAAELDRKYREGFLSEWSVGFAGVKSDPREAGGVVFYESRLYEVSAVNQGANPFTATVAKAADEFDRRLREVEAAVMRAARDGDDTTERELLENLKRIRAAV